MSQNKISNELTRQLLQSLYNEEFVFIDNSGTVLQVNEARALDFMILGYKGTIAVRKARGWRFEDGGLKVPDSFNIEKNQENGKN